MVRSTLIWKSAVPLAVWLLGVVSAAVLRLPFTAAQLSAKGFNAPAEAVRWTLSGFTNTTV